MSWRYDRTWLEEDDVDAPYFDPNRTQVSDIETVEIPTDRPWWSNIPVIDNIYESPVRDALDYFGNIPFVQDVAGVTKPLRQITGALDPLGAFQTILGMAENRLEEEGIEYDLSNIPWHIGQYFTGQEGAITPDDKRFITAINRPFDEDDAANVMDQVADLIESGQMIGDPFAQDEIIKLAMADLGQEKEVRTGPSWDPMGLTNLLGDQIGLINQLTQAGLMNAEQWRDTTLDTLDSVYGDLQADFQAQLDNLSETELASIENMGLTTDDVAAELAEMGVERSVLSLEEQAIADAMALQSGNQMDFAQNLVSSAQLGQADRVTSAMNDFNDIVMGIQTGQIGQIGQLENMAQAAQVQGQALGVDPAILFADMMYGTGIAQQQMSANASAAADAQLWADAEYLAQTVPDFGGDPRLAYSVLSGQLPGNYFKPTEGSFLDSLQPGVLSLLGEEIQNILLNNQNIRFEDAVRLAEDALYFNPME